MFIVISFTVICEISNIVNIKKLLAISVIGFLLSIFSIMYTSMLYLSNSNSGDSISTLIPTKDVVKQKFNSLLLNHKNKKLIVTEMENRYEYNKILQAVITKKIEDSKVYYRDAILLWFVVAIFFSIMGIQLDRIRRNNKGDL